jgi:BTB/POZ domain
MTTLESQENYSLRWNNHQSHILESFDALLQQNSLVDVTLVCADRSLRAHKVVLSACSPFFEKVFNDTPCKHPVIVLKDYQRWVVQAIIDFMYRGEISVPQEHLTQLIQAGESLQIRGLIGAVPVTATESLLIENSIDKRECVSPMPRRKQARPRRRSEDIPQDLSNGPITTKSERDASLSCDEDEDVELHEIAKRVRQNENGTTLDVDQGSEEDEKDLT